MSDVARYLFTYLFIDGRNPHKPLKADGIRTLPPIYEKISDARQDSETYIGSKTKR